ncbi:hypothetical protein N9V74_07305 [Alteromonas sp.]|nr:hypothetical protein [Alteromonas sp.]
MRFHTYRLSLMLLSSFVVSLSANAQNVDEATPDTPLRLEATIRGNKEQPRVLSIVPWQLPKHRNIRGALLWTPMNTQPQPIERNRFLRRVALNQHFSDVDEMKVPPATQDN